MSLEYQKKGYDKCEYLIKAPPDSNIIALNFTDLVGFGSAVGGTLPDTYTDPAGSDREALLPCLPPELTISDETPGPHGIVSSKICKSQNYQTPHVFHFKSNVLKIIYVWVEDEQSGFTLDINFHHSFSKYFSLAFCNHPDLTPPHYIYLGEMKSFESNVLTFTCCESFFIPTGRDKELLRFRMSQIPGTVNHLSLYQ